MSDFTPGPWRVCGATFIWSPEAKANVAAVSELRATTTVEYTRPGIGSHDFGEICANARLIAAAPDLLSACEAALERMQEDGWTLRAKRYEQALNTVQAAIAKARGEA